MNLINKPYSEFDLRYWIPVYGSYLAARNWCKQESPFNDYTEGLPLVKQFGKLALKMSWCGYHAIAGFGALAAIVNYRSNLEGMIDKLLK